MEDEDIFYFLAGRSIVPAVGGEFSFGRQELKILRRVESLLYHEVLGIRIKIVQSRRQDSAFSESLGFFLNPKTWTIEYFLQNVWNPFLPVAMFVMYFLPFLATILYKNSWSDPDTAILFRFRTNPDPQHLHTVYFQSKVRLESIRGRCQKTFFSYKDFLQFHQWILKFFKQIDLFVCLKFIWPWLDPHPGSELEKSWSRIRIQMIDDSDPQHCNWDSET